MQIWTAEMLTSAAFHRLPVRSRAPGLSQESLRAREAPWALSVLFTVAGGGGGVGSTGTAMSL